MINSKADFLNASKLARETVTIESLGGDVEIVELDLKARGELMALTSAGKSVDIGLLIMRSCVPFLADCSDDELLSVSPGVAEEITEAVFRISGMLGDSGEDAGKN